LKDKLIVEVLAKLSEDNPKMLPPMTECISKIGLRIKEKYTGKVTKCQSGSIKIQEKTK
jgi:hypothetical protein